MKKILIIVLVLIMVMATSCDDFGRDVHDDSDNTLGNASDNASDNISDNASDNTKFKKGRIEDDVYTNESADVTFTLLDGWYFASEETLESLMSQAGKFVGEEVAKVANITTIYDCMAISPSGTANIIFMYENTALSGNADISEKDYADIVIEGLISSSAATGLSYQVGDTSEIKIGGKTYYNVVTTVNLGEEIVMEQRYLFRKLVDRMMSVCITTFPGVSDSSDDIIAKICIDTTINTTIDNASDSTKLKGTIKDNVYTNEFADITFTLPDGWWFASFEGTDDAISAISAYCDCMAVSPDGLAYIYFRVSEFRNLAIGYEDFTEKDYYDLSVKSLTSDETTRDCRVGECHEAEIGGNTYLVGTVITDYDSEITFEDVFILRMVGDYMIDIGITTVPGVTTSSDDIIACFSYNASNDASNGTSNDASNDAFNDASNDAPNDAPNDVPNDVPNDEPNDAPNDVPNDAPDSATFKKGKIKGNVYTNESAEVTFTLPDGWTFSSQEELDSLMEQAGEVVGEEASKVAEITTLYDCMAVSADGIANIIIMYENTALSGDADISEKDYAEIVMEGLVSTGAATGFNYQVGDSYETRIGGKTYYCGITTIDLGGVSMEQRYLFRKLGDHMMSVCITTFPGVSDSADDIIAKIS